MGDEPPEQSEPPKPKVSSSRVTPKGTHQASVVKSRKAKGQAEPASGRVTPPTNRSDLLPSPWWVPTLMFGLLAVGALVIILNYVGALGEVSNIKLVVGLVLILGGIIAATQYR